MDFLKAEMERKRKMLQDKDIMPSTKKYFRRGDLVAKEKEEYIKKHANSFAVKLSDGQGPSRIADNEGGVLEEDGVTVAVLPRKEVIRRLRDRNEPIILYGESDIEAFRRLRKLEISEPEINRGLRNDFQEAMERVDEAYLNDILATKKDEDDQSDDGSSKPKAGDVKVIADAISYEEILELSKDLGKGNGDLDLKIISQLLRLLLQIWGQKLNSRPEAEKRSVKGKRASATYGQTQQYLKPLFKKLRNKSIQDDILDSLTIIVGHLLDRNYVIANDAYLQMAIGNAPWPIGVTMVGIHARTGREKIFSKHVAHVLNDETQRKYIQGLKRLMTKCQYFFPTDPSRCVEYGATELEF
ncbi:pre-mRNA-splicing factor 18-like [Daphnia pulicaria]|uniref:pre-mRNA-splicing factor 18-like n=1 Tax=Daphnia pulicaria TaxID=35523 RepID=UPI001EEA0DA9|nr:pre-mRNA-splicing factor 18-like [Daphnia pulicaria]